MREKKIVQILLKVKVKLCKAILSSQKRQWQWSKQNKSSDYNTRNLYLCLWAPPSSEAPVGSNLQVCQVIKRAIKHREMFENDPILAYDHPPLLFFFNFPQCDYVQQLAGSTHTRIGYQTLYFSGYYEISLQQMFGTITWGLVPGLEEERERSCDVLRKNKNTGWWQRWWATNNLNWKDSQKKIVMATQHI